MDPITQAFIQGAAGAGGGATYVDDVFSTYLYDGTNNAININNGLDLSTEGGLVWLKTRNTTYGQFLFDTVRGGTKQLRTDVVNAENTEANGVNAFSTTGYTVGTNGVTDGGYNSSANDYASWSFRKCPGFFDIQTWTGTGSTRTVAHNLGCVPGCVMVRRVDGTEDWAVWHSGATNPGNGGADDKALTLNSFTSSTNSNNYFYSTAPTDSVFTVGTSNRVNGSGNTYIAYIFAGAYATRWSDLFTLSSGYFDYPISNSFEGINPEIVGGWAGSAPYSRTSGNYITITMNLTNHNITVGTSVQVYAAYDSTATVTIDGTTHTSSSGTTHTFSNPGTLTQITIRGNSVNGRTYFTGVKVDGVTLTDGSFLFNGNPNYTAGQESTFGEDEDQPIIKCGAYKGNGGENMVHLGWQPQWLLVKNYGANASWVLLDSTRRVATAGYDWAFKPNNTDAEQENTNWVDFLSKGFMAQNQNEVNENTKWIAYIAIRFPDGYVGKPSLSGTDAFTMDTGNGSSDVPAFDSGFPVDFALIRQPAASQDWFASPRLMGDQYLLTNSDAAQGTTSPSFDKDSNVGWAGNSNYGANYQSWMWKRGKSFDVVAYKGKGINNNGDPLAIRHNLGSVPQMIWLKDRENSYDWLVNHIGLNAGTNYQNYGIPLNTTTVESATAAFGETVPTSTYFYLGGHNSVNVNNVDYIAYLFTTIAGISKVGYYAGSDSEQTITDVGFQPRFCIIRNISVVEDWSCFDTLRGWSAGNDKYIKFNATTAQSDYEFGAPTSTGFTLIGNNSAVNKAGQNFIYYAHA